MDATDASIGEDYYVLSRSKSSTTYQTHDEFVKSMRGTIRKVTVEPLVLLFIIIGYLQPFVLQQYIYFAVSIQNGTFHGLEKVFVCKNSSDKEKVDLIQSLASSMLMNISICYTIATIIFAPFYSTVSDRHGRKLMLLIPCFGVFIKSSIEMAIIKLRWNLNWFYLTESFYGCCGGLQFAIAVCYSYLADISTISGRTKRLAIITVMVACGIFMISLGSGYWVTYHGLFIPFGVSVGLSCLCLIYTIFVLQEPPRMNVDVCKSTPLCNRLKALFTVYRGSSTYETVLLITVVVLFEFYYVSEMSSPVLTVLYLISFPICMSPIEVGYFNAAITSSVNVGMVFVLFVLSRYLSDLKLIFICLISSLIFSAQMTFAVTHVRAYVAAATNLFSFTAFPFIRGFLSKHVDSSQQGALNGGLIFLEMIGSAISRLILMYIYKETHEHFHGMVYIVISCFALVAMIANVIAMYLQLKIKQNNPDPTSINYSE